MTNEQYHADTTHISKSGLDQIEKSPAHYYDKYLNPQRVKEQPTEAMRLGTAVHSAILEPHLFERDYFVFNDAEILRQIGGSSPRATNRYKDWKTDQLENYVGKTEISAEDYLTCLRMRDAVHKHPIAKILLNKGIAEHTIKWTDKDTGALCKCRPDWISQDTGYIPDIKSTEDASPDGFAKSSYNYRYHVQAPYYVDGYEAQFNQKPEGFSFIACEKKPPYLVAVYFVPDEVFNYGRDIYKRNLETYVKARKSGIWDGYGDDFLPLQLPAWAKRDKSF